MSALTSFGSVTPKAHKTGTVYGTYTATAADTGFNVNFGGGGGGGGSITLPTSPSLNQVITITNTGTSSVTVTGCYTATSQEVIVGQTIDTNQAFVYTEIGGMVDLGGFVANAISSDGTIVYGDETDARVSTTGYAGLAFKYSSISGYSSIPTMSRVTACSSDGSIAAGYSVYDFGAGLSNKPAIYSAALGTIELAGFYNQPTANRDMIDKVLISADGSIVMGTDIASGNNCYWSSSTGTVHFNIDLFITIHAISDDGLYAVGDDGTNAWRFNIVNGVVVGSDVLSNCYAYAISPDGSKVAGYINIGPSYSEYIWTLAGGSVTIPAVNGSYSQSPGTAITDDGVLVAENNEAVRWDSVSGAVYLTNVAFANAITDGGTVITAVTLTIPANSTKTFTANPTANPFIKRTVTAYLCATSQSNSQVDYNYFYIDINGIIQCTQWWAKISSNSYAGLPQTVNYDLVDNTSGTSLKTFSRVIENDINVSYVLYQSGIISTQRITVDNNLIAGMPKSMSAYVL